MSRHGVYDLHDGFIPDDDATEEKVITNADRIRSMTDEELAEWLLKNAACPCAAMNGGCALNDDTCRQAWLNWLKEEVKDV